MAQLVVSAAFAAAGTLVGIPPQVGFAIGSYAYGATRSAPGAPRPSAADLRAPKLQYGASWPRLRGRSPFFAPIVLWQGDLTAVAVEAETGKGGGDQVVGYTYKADVLLGIADGYYPDGALLRIRINGKLVASYLAGTGDASLAASQDTDAFEEVRVYLGGPSQLPDPDYEAGVGTHRAIAWRGRFTVFVKGLNFGNSKTMPAIEVEATSRATGADALTLLQSRFIDASPDDESAYDRGAPAQTGGTVGPGQFVVYTENAITPFQPAYLNYTSAGTSNGTDAVTFEAFITGYAIPNVAGIPVLRFWLNAAESSTLHQLLFGYGNCTPVYENAGFGQEYVGSPSQGVRLHVAFVFAQSGLRVYFNGVKVYEAPGSIPPATPLRAQIGDATGYSSDTTSFVVEGFRVRQEEVYTGDSFTPPSEIPPPDGGTWEPLPYELHELVEAEHLRANGGVAGEFDTGDIEGIEILGALVTGSARGVIEAMMETRHFSAVCREKVYYRRLEVDASESVPFADSGAGVGEPGEPFCGPERGNDAELARKVAVQFVNFDADGDNGVQEADRFIGASNKTDRLQALELLTPQLAQGVVETHAQMGRLATVRGAVQCDERYAKYEPTDSVRLVDQDGNSFRVWLEEVVWDRGVFDWRYRLHDPSLIRRIGVATSSYQPSIVVAPPGEVSGGMLDAPIARDADDSYGAYGYASNTDADDPEGAAIFRSANDATYTQAAAVRENAVHGTCDTAFADFTGGNVFDLTTVLRVSVNGALSGATRDAVLAEGANACLVGTHGRWEWAQFTTASLVTVAAGVYTYDLSGWLRGCRATEHNIGNHEAGDTSVLMPVNGRGIRRVADEATDTNALRYIKLVGWGRSVGSADAVEFTNTQVGLKPFAPVDARVSKAADGSVTVTWRRRDRLTSPFLGTTEIPMSEVLEAYEIDVHADGDFDDVVRTLTATSESVTYSGSQQAADFGALPSTLYLDIMQMSAAVGRGYALRVTLPVPSGGIAFEPDTSDAQVLLASGDRWLVAREGEVSGTPYLGFYTVDGTDTELEFLGATEASATATYAAGLPLFAVDGAGGYVLCLRGIGNPSAQRKLFHGTLPAAPVQVVPSFMPANPPVGLWHVTGATYRALLVDKTVWETTDGGASWASQGAISGGPASFPSTITGAHVVKVGSVLAMRHENAVYHCADLDGETWTAATGDIATLPTATYSSSFLLTAIASNGSRAVIVALAAKPSDVNTWALVYTSTDGEDWSLEVEEAVNGPSATAHAAALNDALLVLGVDFLCDVWPVSPGSTQNSVLDVFDFGGGVQLRYAFKAAGGKAGSTKVLAAGNGTAGFAFGSIYRTSNLTSFSLVEWPA